MKFPLSRQGKFDAESFRKGVWGRLPTGWGDVSEADRGDSLRERNPFSKGFSPIEDINFFISGMVIFIFPVPCYFCINMIQYMYIVFSLTSEHYPHL